jgi:hypothetical protein
MGLLDVLADGRLRRMLSVNEEPDEITISDLREEFGDEIVNRGLAYMESLSEADEKYRETVREKNYVKEGMAGFAQSSDDIETSEEADEANSAWQESSEESGLGLDG